jgi:hypothetical protein
MITNYGEVTLEQIQTYETHLNQHNDEKKQQLFCLYKCIMASLSVQGNANVNIWKNQFHHNNVSGGISVLKVIIRESSLDANATTESLRRELTELDAFAISVNGDVSQINARAMLIVEGLAARGQTTTELVTNLFKAYETIKDGEFNRYIKNKKDVNDEQRTPMNPHTLMVLAADKYKNMKKRGEWNAPTADDGRILALKTEIKALKKKIEVKRQKKNADPVTVKPDTKAGSPPGAETREKLVKPEWLLNHVHPSGDVKKPRKWNGVEYFWCSSETGGKCKDKWRQHKPSDCDPEAFKKRFRKNKKKDGDNKKSKLVSAYQAVKETTSNTSDENEGSS